MLIARCTLPAMEVPACLREFEHREIDLSSEAVPWEGSAWITCTQAMPHHDPGWPDKLFITLTVEGERYEFGDSVAIMNRLDACPVPPGSLFVIDPMVPHWLLDHDAAFGEKRVQRWIGVQWEVTRAAAASRAREIARAVEATWATGMKDARYVSW